MADKVPDLGIAGRELRKPLLAGCVELRVAMLYAVFTEIAEVVGKGDNTATSSGSGLERVILLTPVKQFFNYIVMSLLQDYFQSRDKEKAIWHR